MKNILLATQFSLLSCESAPQANPQTNSDNTQSEQITSEMTPEPVLWNPDNFAPPTFMTDDLRSALEKHKWETGMGLIQSTTTEAKVLSTWLAIQNNNVKTVAHHYEAIARHEAIPDDYKNFMLGTIKLSEDKDTVANRHFALISKDSPLHTQSQWMTVQHDLKKDVPKEDTLQSLLTLSTKDHPFTNGDAILSAQIKQTNGGESAYAQYREL